MLKKRIIISLTFLDGILFRTKNFKPDYRYTKNFIDLWSIDELILIDISKKKFSTEFLDLIKFFCTNCFVPISVGGGIKNLDDADTFFKHGADKIVLGTGSLNDDILLNKISKKYGNQSIIQSLDCKKILSDHINYTVMTNSGSDDMKMDPISLADKAITIEPKSMNALNIKSKALFKLRKFEESIIIADKAITIDPKNMDVLLFKSEALFKLQKFEECNIIADKTLFIDPKNVTALNIKS